MLSPPADLLDEAAALERVGGNVQALREVAGFFLEDYPRWLADLQEYLRQGNVASLHFTAHRMRGSLGALGADAASAAARQLEMLARAGNLAASADACAALETALARLQPVLAALAAPAN